MTTDKPLKEPQKRAVMQVVQHLLHGKNVIFQSPTGSGKTRMAIELLKHAESDRGGIFYVNRKSLVGQTRSAFEDANLDHGVRAADHEEAFDPEEVTQIASADTERHRVFGPKASWLQHDCGLVIVDEGHIQKGETMRNIMADHMSRGAQIVLMSATPVSLKRMLPDAELVVSGTLQEYRDCGLLVKAVCRSIEQPDLRKIKRSQTGEFILDGKKKKIYTQTIVGNVIDRWRRYNPDARPTMLYAPGKAESAWFTDQFNNAGVPWCHVDATEAFIGGKRYQLTRSLWEDVLGKYKDGVYKGISSRFKCLDLETEVLTSEGWVSHDEFDKSMLVATMRMDGSLSWEHATKTFAGSHESFYSMKSKKGVDVCVTEDHDLVVRSIGCAWKKEPASVSASRKSAFQIPVAAYGDVVDLGLTDDEISVIGWMMTDGHVRDYGAWSITQSLAQPEYIHSHIRSSLRGAGLTWKEPDYIGRFDGKEFPFRRYSIGKAEVNSHAFTGMMSKDFDKRLLLLSRRQLGVLLYAINLADGSKRKNPTWKPKTLEISKGNITFLSRLQALCVTRGMRANIHSQHECPRLYVTPNRSHATLRGATPCKGKFKRVRMEKVSMEARTWCLQVPSGTLITRRNGKVAVVGNCREGLDVPSTYQIILATPIGSLASYLQTVGRGLRAAPGKEHCVITDHGGNYLRHGSPNRDRDWSMLCDMSGAVASSHYESQIRNSEIREPLRCPKCEGERLFGIKCPHCGFEHIKSQREVIMEDGAIVTMEGPLLRVKKTREKKDTQGLWDSMYYGFRRKKVARTFSQMEAFFCKEYGYWPTRTLNNMPLLPNGWHKYVHDVPRSQLK